MTVHAVVVVVSRAMGGGLLDVELTLVVPTAYLEATASVVHEEMELKDRRYWQADCPAVAVGENASEFVLMWV